MAKTLQQILGARNLVGVIQGIKGGVPTDILPASFMRITRRVEGDHCTYTKIEGTRKTARMVLYGSPSRNRNLKGVSEVPIKLIHTAEHIIHKPVTLLNLKNMDNENKQKLGRMEITRQSREFRQLFDNLRMAAVFAVLSSGYVYFDEDGNLLPNSSGAFYTIDFQVPSGNKNYLDVFGTGAIIGATWATAGTDIIGDVVALKKAARKLTGYPIIEAFYGENILKYFLGNTVLKEMINRNTGFQTAFTSNEIPDGFLGLKWTPAYEAFFQDDDGTNQDFWSGDKIVFTPTPSPDWWEYIEGSYPVPTNLGSVHGDGAGALGNVTEVNGMFNYAILLEDPVTIKQVAGDTMIPVLKVPGAIFIADVTP